MAILRYVYKKKLLRNALIYSRIHNLLRHVFLKIYLNSEPPTSTIFMHAAFNTYRIRVESNTKAKIIMDVIQKAIESILQIT